jgi:ElaB/YqjD/DUF883 family membrane-anchored ribosome-binding protein
MTNNVSHNIATVKEKALDASATVRERLDQGCQSLRAFTTEKPAQALGMALGMGVLVGWWLKRR